MVSPIKNTLRELARHRLIIDVTCKRCGHRGLFDPGWLIQRLNPLRNFRTVRYHCRCGSYDIEPIAYPEDWDFSRPREDLEKSAIAAGHVTADDE